MQRSLRFEQYAIFGLLTVLFLLVMAPFAQALLLGLLMALVFFPLNNFLEAKLALPRALRALMVMFLLSVLALLPVLLLGVSAFTNLRDLIIEVKAWLQNLPEILSASSGIIDFIRILSPIPLEELTQKLVEPLSDVATFMAHNIGKLAAKFPVFILEYLLFLLALYFGLLDGERMGKFLKKILPFEEEELERLFRTAKQICRGVVLGALVAGLTQGLLLGIGYAIAGIPKAFFFGMLASFMSLVPIVGAAPIGIGGLIYLGVQGSWGAFVVLLIFYILAAVSDNVIKPIILRGEAELHPLLGLVSALGGLAAFGFLGIFLGPLLVALMMVVSEIFIQKNKV